MNLLPLVTTILLMLALATHTIFEKKIASQQLGKSYFGYMHAARNVQNKCIHKSFAKIKQTNKKPPETKPDDPQKNSPKYKFKPQPLNIWPLLVNGKEEEKELYELFTNLLHILYSHCSFFQKNQFENFLADKIIDYAQKNLKKEASKELHLEKFSFDDPSLQQAYYKILKGTKFYDKKNCLGYPSLFEYITISSNQKTPKISIPYSPKEILTAIFNEKIALAIEQKQFEKESFHPISKKELENILTQHPLKKEISWTMLSFSKSPKQKQKNIHMVGMDKKTDIRLKQTLYYKR